MSPNDCYFTFDKILPLSSSVSSDSESLFDVDLKNSEKHIEDQWEIIERTLYQEPGPQVTDPELLKECKLWRDTFPHFRVTGTKIDLKGGDAETDESFQFDINKLNEKRESIQKKVVGELVERLIAKFGTNKNLESKVSSVQITEIDDDDSEGECQKMITASLEERKMMSVTGERRVTPSVFGEKVYRGMSPKDVKASISTEKESYFERGKPKMRVIDDVKSPVKEAEKGLREILNSRDKIKDYKNLQKLQESGTKPGFMERSDFDLKNNEKPNARGGKPKTKVPPSDSLTNLYKPFKMATKIDKKYENLLGQIMERRQNEPDRYKHCRTSSSGIEMRNRDESLENLRIGSGFNFRKNLPKINKFKNNWLERGNARACYGLEDDPSTGKNLRKNKLPEEVDLSEEDESEADIDELIENIKKEMSFDYKGRPRKVEGINIKRSKSYKVNEKAVTSSSCGNLPKKEKQETKTGREKCPKKPNLKNRGKLPNPTSRVTNIMASKTSLLPPIETGIICKELTGRPKIGPKIPPKRFK